MHLKRWISGLILAPSLILFILYAPAWLFFLLILAAIYVGLTEFYRLVWPGIPPGQKNLAILLGFGLALAMACPDRRGFSAGLLGVTFIWFIGALFRKEEFPVRVQEMGRHLLGLLYVVLLLGHLIFMRELAQGKIWILFTLVSVYCGDTTAFYVGRAWGKRKLAPALSPNKTIEGGWGAVGGSMAGALFFKVFFFPELGIVPAALLGAGIGAIGQSGDLFESLLKRSASVKDSGALIPGHGGFLDRIDSVLFAVPFVYYGALVFSG